MGNATIGLDTLRVILSAVLALMMQAGFVLLETGSTRMKNAGHIAVKTIFAVGLCSLVLWQERTRQLRLFRAVGGSFHPQQPQHLRNNNLKQAIRRIQFT